MENLLVLLFCIGVGVLLFFSSLFIMGLVQLISYRVFNFNIYKKFVLPLIK